MATGQELLNQIKDRFPDAITVDNMTERVAFLSIGGDLLVGCADFLSNHMGARFVMSIGTDKRPVNKKYEISYIFCLDEHGFEISLKVLVDEEKPEIPSITAVVPASNWSEREVQD